MKTNKVPNEIYIFEDELQHEDHVVKYGVNQDKGIKGLIEYIRTDVFINKLECWMNENFYQYAGEFAEGILGQFNGTEDAIDSFKKYLKED